MWRARRSAGRGAKAVSPRPSPSGRCGGLRMARSCTAKGSLIRPKPSQPPGRLSSCFGQEAALAWKAARRALLDLPLRTSLHRRNTMESLEIIVLPVASHWRPSPWRHLDHPGAPLAQEHRAAPVDHLFRPGTHEVAALDDKRLRAIGGHHSSAGFSGPSRVRLVAASDQPGRAALDTADPGAVARVLDQPEAHRIRMRHPSARARSGRGCTCAAVEPLLLGVTVSALRGAG